MHQIRLRIEDDYKPGLPEDQLGFLPKVLHFCANSTKAFQKLEEILLTYAEEAEYDARLVIFLSKLVNKIHLACRSNPIDLHPLHLQPLIGF